VKFRGDRVNPARRNLTKGQQAMALAMIYPESKRGSGNIDEARKHAETASFRRVQEGRLVLRHSWIQDWCAVRSVVMGDHRGKLATVADFNTLSRNGAWRVRLTS
jgi:hypothetical protein